MDIQYSIAKSNSLILQAYVLSPVHTLEFYVDFCMESMYTLRPNPCGFSAWNLLPIISNGNLCRSLCGLDFSNTDL